VFFDGAGNVAYGECRLLKPVDHGLLENLLWRAKRGWHRWFPVIGDGHFSSGECDHASDVNGHRRAIPLGQSRVDSIEKDQDFAHRTAGSEVEARQAVPAKKIPKPSKHRATATTGFSFFGAGWSGAVGFGFWKT
jgi:hypothetical protein